LTLNCLILLQQVLTSAQDEVNMDRSVCVLIVDYCALAVWADFLSQPLHLFHLFPKKTNKQTHNSCSLKPFPGISELDVFRDVNLNLRSFVKYRRRRAKCSDGKPDPPACMNCRPNRVSSDLRARKAISEYQPRCNSKRCAEGEHNWFEASIDEPHYSIRPPFRQSAPVKCTDTGLPPPCVPKLKKARGLEVDHADPK
jgi:hypothetical protein